MVLLQEKNWVIITSDNSHDPWWNAEVWFKEEDGKLDCRCSMGGVPHLLEEAKRILEVE